MPESDGTALRESSVATAIRTHRLIAILRRVEPRAALLALVDDLVDDGIQLLEITFDAAGAADDLRAVRAHLAERGRAAVAVGAGTILGAAALDAAIEAGAAFAVSPITDPGLIEHSVGAGLPFLPGALSPTEVASAWAHGATFVKIFPAASVGPTHLRELHGPFRDIELIATGGVDGANARAFLDHGAVAVGIGSWLARASSTDRRALVDAIGRPA